MNEENYRAPEEEKKKKHGSKHFVTGLLIGAAASVLLTGCFFTGAARYALQQAAKSGSGQRIETGVETTEVGDVKKNPERLDYGAITGKIRLIQKLISQKYLFDEDADKVTESIYAGLMQGLGDPYSVYYTEAEYKSMMETTEASYSGIGASLQKNMETGICTVVHVYEGSPAEAAGLKPGDIIYSVDGNKMDDYDLDYFVSTFVRGKEGTSLVMTIFRGETRDEIDLNITRGVISIPTVAHKMLEDKVGYVAVLGFEMVTDDQFRAAVDDLTAQGMEKLVIDLRSNPGGVVNIATSMLDYMLPDGLLVYTAGRSGVGDKYYSNDGHEIDIPTVILVNGNSASASEIFAGAYRDFGRAKLVGTTTFGKGIVQQIIPLGDGSAIKLTIEHYYTPSGFDLHGTGLAPDVEVASEEGDEAGTDHDAQLKRALEVLAEEQ